MDCYATGTVEPLLPLTDVQRRALDACDTSDLKDDAEALEVYTQWVSSAPCPADEGLAFELEQKDDGRTYITFTEHVGEFAFHVLQQVLREMPEEKVPFITVMWAETASSVTPGSHGGGAAFITRGSIRVMTTWKWLRESTEGFERMHGRRERVQKTKTAGEG